MKFRPLHDGVVVRRVRIRYPSKGGIIIPETAKEKPMQGEVPPSASGAGTKPANSFPSTSRQASPSCSASGPAPKSRPMAKTS